MSKRFTYDVYFVDVPKDVTESLEEAKQIAVNEAQDRARLWCSPCEWYASLLGHGFGLWSFRVTRKRMRKAVMA